MNGFRDAVVLITGAASGIGAATATLLAEGGAKKLILADLDEERLADFAFSLPCERQLLVGDVGNERLWASADLTGLTHAVVNAGIAAGGTIEETSFEQWRQVLAVNLDGAFLSLQASMRSIRAGRRGGAIVLTSSVSGIKAEPGTAAYGASKAGVIQLTRVAARECAADQIRVNAIAPGGVETPIWNDVPYFVDLVASRGSEEAAFRAMSANAPLGRFAKAEEIAHQILFLLSDQAAFVTGTCLVADGGYSL